MEGFHRCLEDSAFIALDTEHVATTSERHRILHQIGLAYIPNLPKGGTSIPATGCSDLQSFYVEHGVEGLTLDINISDEQRRNFQGSRGIPIRRSHRFGKKQQVDLEDAESLVVDFIHQKRHMKANIVLIGFELTAEWTYLLSVFPQAIPFFSAWKDLRDIAEDVTSSVGVIPGLSPLLQILGYHWMDIRPNGRKLGGGNADNAGDDAVATCALAQALLFSENHQKLRLRQERGKIARIFSRKKGYQSLGERDYFAATVHANGPLPSAINSGMKLARQFFDFAPQTAGILSADMAYLTFRNQDQMNNFIAAAHGMVLPRGEVLSVQFYSMVDIVAEAKVKREQKQELIRKARSEKVQVEIEIGDLDDLFS
ncbi:hypothetical protein HJFPF1_01753 [Paramyrothecium foliicola]|nr:hypothetical protein HJFPF1_01753 [Paramyrothecium foliicola]